MEHLHFLRGIPDTATALLVEYVLFVAQVSMLTTLERCRGSNAEEMQARITQAEKTINDAGLLT